MDPLDARAAIQARFGDHPAELKVALAALDRVVAERAQKQGVAAPQQPPASAEGGGGGCRYLGGREPGFPSLSISAWVGKVSAATGAPTISQQTGPEKPITPEAQAELDAAEAERAQRLRGTGWSEGTADARDWGTLARAAAIAAAPAAGAAALPPVAAAAAPLVPAASTVALRGGGALQGQSAGAREARKVGLPESVGRVAGGALGAAFPGATLAGEAAGVVSGQPGAAVPVALASILLRKKLGPAGTALLRLLGVGTEAAEAGAGATAAGAAARGVAEVTAPAAGSAARAAAAGTKAANLEELLQASLNPAAAARATAASRVGLEMPATVLPEAQASAIATRLRQLYQTSGANKRAILEEGQRIFGKDWPGVKKLILSPNVKIPVLLLGLGGAWRSGDGAPGGATGGDGDLGGEAA